MPKLEVECNFKYITIDGNHVKLTHGEVLLIVMGVTLDKERAILDITLAKEEDKRNYWELLVQLWKKYNVVIIVADGAKALDSAINASQMKIKRQYCIVHMKRNMSKDEREELDKLIKSAKEGEIVVNKYGVLNYLEAPRGVWKWLKSNNLVESFNECG
ncbi:MAG: transposase [Saccharolobus sp.]|jgi:putative transposase|uniref:transposase n=1 Tax=Saccharolobus sp. TaxID=2100761 RepID=UPI0028CD0283|nr:transposase [Saccharolobus sp.]MDT7862473.1 transposase [Saccharolobus sp.]